MTTKGTKLATITMGAVLVGAAILAPSAAEAAPVHSAAPTVAARVGGPVHTVDPMFYTCLDHNYGWALVGLGIPALLYCTGANRGGF